MYVDNITIHNYITYYQKINKYLCSYVCRNMHLEISRKMHFSKNHNIRENNFDFQENYIYLHQNQQKRYEIQNQERDQAYASNLWQVQGCSRSQPNHREPSALRRGSLQRHEHQRWCTRRIDDDCGRDGDASSEDGRQGAPEELRSV